MIYLKRKTINGPYVLQNVSHFLNLLENLQTTQSSYLVIYFFSWCIILMKSSTFKCGAYLMYTHLVFNCYLKVYLKACNEVPRMVHMYPDNCSWV